MNEITQIHLGRTAFTIAVDAQKLLRDYLAAVKKHMGGNEEAINEVELRMAELLLERGIKGDKVVLAIDIEYLKSQLGEPGDFGDGDDEDEAEREEPAAPKRLFRDTKRGLIAGVAAGLAAYFGIKPVIVRVLFVLVLLTGFGGLFQTSLAGGFWLMVLAYIALWVAIPKANTGSDRLQMQGKPVTVDAIKEAVERTDVKTAATRVQRVAESLVSGVLRVIVAAVGFGLMLAGIAAILGTIMIGVYWAVNRDLVPARVFPVGAGEVALVWLGFIVVFIAALFFLITGWAVVRRKWPLPGWGLGAIVAVFLASVAVGGALTADAAPKISERYEAERHTYTRTLPTFDSLNVVAEVGVQIQYEESTTYRVTAQYWGSAAFSGLKTSVTDRTLTVNTTALADSLLCRKLCLVRPQTLVVVVYGPKLKAVTGDLHYGQLGMSEMHNQALTVRAHDSTVAVPNFVGDNLAVTLNKDGTWTVAITGDYMDPTGEQHASFYNRTADLSARNIDLTFDGTCGVDGALSNGPPVTVSRFDNLTINGEKIGGHADLLAAFDKPGASAAKCLTIPSYLTDYM